MRWVARAASNSAAQTITMESLLVFSCQDCLRANQTAAGRKTISTPVMKTAVKVSVTKTRPAWALARLTTKAKRHHAVTSSTAAQARATVPMRLLCICRSVRMRDSTGKEVMDMATARKSAKTVKGTSRVENSG